MASATGHDGSSAILLNTQVLRRSSPDAISLTLQRARVAAAKPNPHRDLPVSGQLVEGTRPGAISMAHGPTNPGPCTATLGTTGSTGQSAAAVRGAGVGGDFQAQRLTHRTYEIRQARRFHLYTILGLRAPRHVTVTTYRGRGVR